MNKTAHLHSLSQIKIRNCFHRLKQWTRFYYWPFMDECYQISDIMILLAVSNAATTKREFNFIIFTIIDYFLFDWKFYVRLFVFQMKTVRLILDFLTLLLDQLVYDLHIILKSRERCIKSRVLMEKYTLVLLKSKILVLWKPLIHINIYEYFYYPFKSNKIISVVCKMCPMI